MDSDKLRALQSPLKSQYKKNPESAVITLSSEGKIGDGITCKVDTGKAMVEAGLHPATGGDGMAACSGDMLLDALVACAGVTLNAVATAIGVSLGEGTKVTADGDLDFRGTLGVSKEAPVGFKEIRLQFHLDTDAEQEQIDSLIKLTERYCVVFQTLNNKPALITGQQLAS
ncbi:OsmC family protein [soil metagenome]